MCQYDSMPSLGIWNCVTALSSVGAGEGDFFIEKLGKISYTLINKNLRGGGGMNEILGVITGYLAAIFLYSSVIGILLYPVNSFWNIKVGSVYIAKPSIIIVACTLTLLTITVSYSH